MNPTAFSYETSESLDLTADSARDFALQYIKPHVREWG